jgi:hypothetical protein
VELLFNREGQMEVTINSQTTLLGPAPVPIWPPTISTDTGIPKTVPSKYFVLALATD